MSIPLCHKNRLRSDFPRDMYQVSHQVRTKILACSYASIHLFTRVLSTYLGYIENKHLYGDGQDKHMAFTLERGNQTFHNHMHTYHYGKAAQ